MKDNILLLVKRFKKIFTIIINIIFIIKREFQNPSSYIKRKNLLLAEGCDLPLTFWKPYRYTENYFRKF